MIITILGLGRMGSAIARNLIELGHEVTLYNRTRAQALALAAGQALPGAHRKAVQVADTVADAVREARVAITVVAGDEAEEALAFGPGGLLEHLPEGAIHLCMSTLSPAVSRRLAEAHQAAGHGYVAAPMLGNPSAAKARRLWLLAAGPEIQVNRCLVLLESLSHSITRVGPRADLAHALKLGADALSVAMVETLAEVLAYGNKLGFPSAEYLRILNPGLFKSPLLDAFGGLMAREDYAPTNQTLDLAARDLEQLVQTARDLDLAMPMTGPLLQQVRAAQARGLGDRDLVALSLVRRQEAGLAPDGALAVRASTPSASARDRRVHGGDRRASASGRPGPAEGLAPPATGGGPAPAAEGQAAILVPEAAPLEAAAAPDHPAPDEGPDAGPAQPPPAGKAGPTEVSPYPARDADGPVMLDLWQTTHFEQNGGTVWAWVEGRRHATFWRDLDEVERTLGQVLLVRIQHRILLSPQAIVEFQPLFGGRARVSVAGGVSLTASRDAVRRLKFLLGY